FGVRANRTIDPSTRSDARACRRGRRRAADRDIATDWRIGVGVAWPQNNAGASRCSRICLGSSPPPYPVRLPSAPMTRWHGTTIGIGLAPLAMPTARDAAGSIPSDAAISPYDAVVP